MIWYKKNDFFLLCFFQFHQHVVTFSSKNYVKMKSSIVKTITKNSSTIEKIMKFFHRFSNTWHEFDKKKSKILLNIYIWVICKKMIENVEKFHFILSQKKNFQIHDGKYKIVCSHHCKSLLVFVDFTIGNIIFTIFYFFVSFTIVIFSKFSYHHKWSYFTTVNTRLIVLTTVNTCWFSLVLPLIIVYS